MSHNEYLVHCRPFLLNLLAYFFSPLFSVEKRSCQEQLRQDFGEFPPLPLRCESLTGEFSVVRTSGIGQIYCDLAVQFHVINADIGSLSTDFVANLGADRLQDLQDLQSTLDRLGPRGSRFAMRAFFGWLFIVRTVKAIRHGTTRPNVLGLFVPFFKDGLQIIIKTRGHLNKSDAPTISHEHIHLLQHRNPESHCRHVRSPQALLTEEGWTDSFLLYILEKIEVEARLHEAVLSFYRTHRYLPTTVLGFLGLLASSNVIGLLIISILESGGVSFQRGLGTYLVREARPVEQLAYVLMDIKTPELQRRYLTEVLPVMYGNLLKYYGDDVASRNFLSFIDRPNFYDDLYAAQAS